MGVESPLGRQPCQALNTEHAPPNASAKPTQTHWKASGKPFSKLPKNTANEERRSRCRKAVGGRRPTRARWWGTFPSGQLRTVPARSASWHPRSRPASGSRLPLAVARPRAATPDGRPDASVDRGRMRARRRASEAGWWSRGLTGRATLSVQGIKDQWGIE